MEAFDMSQFEILNDRPSGGIPPREVLRHGITKSILDGETALFDVLPGLGKSRSAAKIAEHGIPISVFTNLTENYGQFGGWSRDFGVESEKFPRSTVDCPSLSGQYPEDDTVKEAMEALDNGWPVSEIHDEYNLPCQQNRECEYIEKVQNLKVEGSGLLVGHYTQAYVESYVKDRVAVLDEDAFEEYYQSIKNPAQKAQDFIDSLNNFPLNDLKPLSGQKRDKILKRLENIGLEPEDHPNSVGEFHAKAPLIAYAIYGAEELDNGLKYIELPGNRVAVFDKWYPTDGEATIWLLDPPDFSKAEAVIGLDATPCIPKWERILGDDFTHYRLFDEDERNQHLRDQGYEFIQLNSYAWPSQGGNLSIEKCEAYLREVHREHGERPDLITSKDVRSELEDRGLDHLWNRDLHFGNHRGKNHLKDSELLVVLGSPSRRDNYFKHLTALFGESAERVKHVQGMNLSFGSTIGDDLLEQTRRGGVFQAAMRAGREKDAQATVFIATGLVPEWLETKRVGKRLPNGGFDACPNPRGDSNRAVIQVLRNEDGISGHEVARRAKLPKSTVSDSLNRLREDGLVEKKGRGRGTKWHDRGLEGANIAGNADIERIAGIPSKSSIRASRLFSGQVSPRQQLPNSPEDRYPDWIRDVQHRLEERRLDEQIKERWRDQQ